MSAGEALRARRNFEDRTVPSSEDRDAVLEVQPEAFATMDHPVMPPAQQQEILERARTTFRPVHDVMRVAPSVWAVASREPADPVAHDHRSADGGWNDRRAATSVERL